jgi:hypothetical protein
MPAADLAPLGSQQAPQYPRTGDQVRPICVKSSRKDEISTESFSNQDTAPTEIRRNPRYNRFLRLITAIVFG